MERKELLKEVLSDPEMVELLQMVLKQSPTNDAPNIPTDKPKETEAQALARIDEEINRQEAESRRQQNSELVDACYPFDDSAELNGIKWEIHANVPTRIPSTVKATIDAKLKVDSDNRAFLRSQGIYVE